MRTTLLALLFAFVTLVGGSIPASAAPSMSAAPAAVAQTAEVTLPGNWSTNFGASTVVHSAPEHARIARRLARHADEAIPELAAELGLPVGQRIRVILAPDQASFRSLQPGNSPAWADGTAWPLHGLIYLRAPELRRGDAAPLEQVLNHELVHVMLGRAFAPRQVPHWLQEGTAKVLAEEVRPEQTGLLAAGTLGDDNLLSLDSLTNAWPNDPVRAQLAYVQSAHLVAFLRNTYGQDAFREMVRRMARGDTVDAALLSATGKSTRQIDRAWRARLASSPLWIQQVFNDTTLLGLGGIALVVGWVSVRRRRRAQLAGWERQEALQDAIYASLAGDWAGLPPLPPRGRPVWPHPEPELAVH